MQYRSASAAKDMDLYCGACKAIVDEVEYSVSKVDPRKMIDIGSFRLDPDGKMKAVKVPLARSESQLTEFLEKVCDDISSDYVQNEDKKTGTMSLKRMVTRDGKMSGDVDFQALMQKAQTSGDKPPDTDSKKVKFICESIIEEHEEDFIKYFSDSDDAIVEKVCQEIGEYCTEDQITEEAKVEEPAPEQGDEESEESKDEL